jgi:hypothetical protein
MVAAIQPHGELLHCPQCGGQMKVIAFIEPPQVAVIERILRHCGLWRTSAPRALSAGYISPPPDEDADRHTAASDEPEELTYVDIDTFEATF